MPKRVKIGDRIFDVPDNATLDQIQEYLATQGVKAPEGGLVTKTPTGLKESAKPKYTHERFVMPGKSLLPSPRTAAGIVGAGIGATAALPSWATVLGGIPATALAGGAGYTGATHLYDLLTSTMPYGATTSREYAGRTIPSELAAGGVQASVGPALNVFGANVLAPIVSAVGAKQTAGQAGTLSAVEIAKLLGKMQIKYFTAEHIGEWLGKLAGFPGGGKAAGEVVGALLATGAGKGLTEAGREALVNLINYAGTSPLLAMLEGELVRRGLSPDEYKPTTTLPPNRADFLERFRGARGVRGAR